MRKLLLSLLLVCCVVPSSYAQVIMMRGGLQPETIAYLALPSPTLTAAQADAYVRSIKLNSGNVKISSITAQVSNASGAYFATQMNSDPRLFALISGCHMRISSSTGNYLDAPIAAGLGETYGTNLITDPTFQTPLSWGTTGTWVVTTGQAAIVNGGGNATVYQSASVTKGQLFRFNMIVSSFSAAGGNYLLPWYDSGAYGPPFFGAGTFNSYWTSPYTDSTHIGLLANGGGITATVTAINYWPCLTPAGSNSDVAAGIYGVLFTSGPTLGGAFVPNSSSYSLEFALAGNM